MKPRNFPGRKNDRRKAALARMTAPSAEQQSYQHPYIRLIKLIVPDAIARGVRTKKDRRDRAKFALRG